ncbi:MAG TPA: TlpA disulfide reductase family protein [Chitinophagaceae bacterium]|nr:TlpA disulfide reductase family protein [Chitinophagaceae bacterium]HPH31796.1 TlpA disulfide reductase family protein [Chitinophagaceae bacterium]
MPGIRLDAQEVRRVKITDMEKLMSESKHPLVINFWATWCTPCVEELPSLIREVKKHEADSLQLILVSLDDKENFPEKLRDFIRARNYEGTFLWLDETNADYFCPLIDSSWSGAIPATLFLHKKNGYRKFVEAKLSDRTLQDILKEMFRSPSRNK